MTRHHGGYRHLGDFIVIHKSSVALALIVILVVFLCLSQFIDLNRSSRGSSLNQAGCDVLIGGGGISGVYMAYRLGPLLPDQSVCIIEEKDEWGGRLKTIRLGNGELADVGGVRVNDDHPLMKKLSHDLGVEWETNSYLALEDTPDDMSKINVEIVSRGFRVNNTLDLRYWVYPRAGSTLSGWDVLLDRESELYRHSPLQDSFSFIQKGLGSVEDMSYFLSTFRFAGDFQAVDRKTYSEFAEADTINTVNHYPKKGMQAFVTEMVKRFTPNVKLMPMRSIMEIGKRRNGGFRLLLSDETVVLAKRLILTMPPLSLSLIKGDALASIIAHPMIKQSRPVPVTTVTMRYDSLWWEALGAGRRIWTDSNCIQLMEQPIVEERRKSMAFRSVYADGRCALEWALMYEQGGVELVTQTVMNYMAEIYPGENIPHPLETHVHVWQDAWHFEKPGAAYTMKQKEEWAVNPEQGIHLVGEAYNLKRTWAEGAIQSCVNLLRQQYNTE